MWRSCVVVLVEEYSIEYYYYCLELIDYMQVRYALGEVWSVREALRNNSTIRHQIIIIDE